MTVREFIEFQNPEKVIDGKISFKVIWHGDSIDRWCGTWFFYNDKNETPENDTIEKFCNNDDIVECMDMEIYDFHMEVNLDYDGQGTINYCMNVHRNGKQ